MSWLFSKNGGAYQYATTSSAPAIGADLHTSLWFYITSSTSTDHACSTIWFDSGNFAYLGLTSSGNLAFIVSSSGNNYPVYTANTYTKNTWQHAWASWEKATTAIAVSLNGGTVATNLSAKFPVGTASYIQISGTNVFAPSIEGYIAEYSILSSGYNNFASIVAGASALTSPGAGNLLGYWDLCGWGGDCIGGRAFTASSNGGGVADLHPPVSYPGLNFPLSYSTFTGSPWYYYKGMGIL